MTPGEQCFVTGIADRKDQWNFGETRHHPPILESPQLSKAYTSLSPLGHLLPCAWDYQEAPAAGTLPGIGLQGKHQE